MAINFNNCSFQLVRDTRMAVSLSISGITAVALLASLVALAYLQYLPPTIAYPIAGGSFIASLLIGSLIATLRSKNGQISHDAPQGGLSVSVQPPPINKAAPPPIEEVIKKASLVTVNPNAKRSFPPSEVWPFITTEFELALTVGEEKFIYNLPITEFRDEEGRVYADFVYNDEIHSTVVNQTEGREFSEDNHPWTVETEKPPLKAYYLNEKMLLDGCLSCFSAWSRLGYLLENNQNDAARYFITAATRGSITFQVPGLESVSCEGVVVTFTRDVFQPLINSDQIELLKKSDIEWHSEMGYQLGNPIWNYNIRGPILSVERKGDDHVLVEYSMPSLRPGNFKQGTVVRQESIHKNE